MNNSVKNEVIVLGSGTSTGVPILGCSCDVCNSTAVKDQRSRTSIIIKSAQGETILVDTTPDLRSQLLRESIKKIDNCIITHEHADHCHGIDDLRPFNFFYKSNIDIFTSVHCAHQLRIKFAYIFNSTKKVLGGGIPQLTLQEIPNNSEREICSLKFQFFELQHGHAATLLFTQDKFAYLVDFNALTDQQLQSLKKRNLELLIIDCVRVKPHRTHLCLQQALDYIAAIGPKKARLIHMSHDWTHAQLSEICEKHSSKEVEIRPTFDGEKLSY